MVTENRKKKEVWMKLSGSSVVVPLRCPGGSAGGLVWGRGAWAGGHGRGLFMFLHPAGGSEEEENCSWTLRGHSLSHCL